MLCLVGPKQMVVFWNYILFDQVCVPLQELGFWNESSNISRSGNISLFCYWKISLFYYSGKISLFYYTIHDYCFCKRCVVIVFCDFISLNLWEFCGRIEISTSFNLAYKTISSKTQKVKPILHKIGVIWSCEMRSYQLLPIYFSFLPRCACLWQQICIGTLGLSWVYIVCHNYLRQPSFRKIENLEARKILR